MLKLKALRTLQVAHQRKMFVEYEKRERRRKVRHGNVFAALAQTHAIQSSALAAWAGLTFPAAWLLACFLVSLD